MYKAFYSLKSKPFEITPDPMFLWLGGRYKEALFTMRYGILENKGFLLLTGAAGTGKTTLINALTESLDRTVMWSVLSNPNLPRLDFYNAIAKGFGITKELTSKVQFLIQFSNFLHKAEEEKKKVLLLIDNCHQLSQDLLEELRLLSNIEKSDTKLINIFFVGQREFLDMLAQQGNRAVRQRLALKVDLAPLTALETDSYIRHRLKIAGSEERLFTDKALHSIFRYCQGNPRKSNMVCDQALTLGGLQRRRSIDHKIIEECIRTLNMPPGFNQGASHGLRNGKERRTVSREKFADGERGVGGAGRSTGMKFGLAGAALALGATVLWYQLAKEPIHIRNEADKPASQQTVVETPSGTHSSAVTVVENDRGTPDDQKVVEENQTSQKKNYGDGDFAQPETALRPTAGRVSGLPESGQGDERVVQNPVVLQSAVDKDVPALKVPVTIEAKVTPAIVSGQEATMPPVAPVSVQLLVPSLPAKIILPLAPNSLKLTAEGNREYNGFVELLRQRPRAKLLVKGFVSSTSDSPENIKLSEDRAQAVRRMLVASGIAAEMIQVKGMGNQEPIAPNDTSDGRMKNRRVEIVVVEDGR
ncbi:MAG: AAA family ATPase [Desulforhopalus sp.]|nr:AAA family ATPase [Desulforhopalus sp.]